MIAVVERYAKEWRWEVAPKKCQLVVFGNKKQTHKKTPIVGQALAHFGGGPGPLWDVLGTTLDLTFQGFKSN